MKFSNSNADFFVPNEAQTPEAALKRTTHLCVSAHQDDIEIMAYNGIAECFGRPDRAFTGVVVTNGAGSPRAGIYADYTDEAMQKIRRLEQRKAAYVGGYAAQIQLGHTSAAVKDAKNAAVQADLAAIFAVCTPQVVYLHNPADKHDTHVAVLGHVLKALRALPAARRPARVYGCEVWRDLDWLADADKQSLDAGAYPNIAAAVLGVFDSQISGGKRYDLATAGRRLANATYGASHATDTFQSINWAMDLTPLVRDPSLSIRDYTAQLISHFQAEVAARLGKFC